MGSSGDQTLKAEPWGPAKKPLRGAIREAGGLYDAMSFAPESYMGSTGQSTFAGPSGATMDAVRGIGQMARGDMNNGNPFLAGARQTVGQASRGAGVGSGLIGTGASTMRGLVGESSLGGGVSDYLSSMMGGGAGREAMERARDYSLSTAIPAAVSQFSGAGLTNSSAAMDTVGRAAMDATAPYEYGFEQSNLGRGMQAAGMLQGAQAGDLSRDASLGSSLAGLGLQERGVAMQAAGMAPDMYAAQYMPAEMLARSGATRDAFAQAERDAEVAAYNQDAGRMGQNFMTYSDLLRGLGGMGSSQVQPGPSGLQRLGGSALGGLGTYGALMANPATAPFATIGGLSAGIMGLL